VAEAAGVSLTTVTHALNDTPGARVQEETRRRVREVAAQLGYQSSFAGTALASGQTRTIGLLQPAPEMMEYTIYQQITHGLALAMEEAGYHLLLLFRTPEQSYRSLITQGRIDGIFILQSDQETRDILTAAQTGTPTVVINKHFEDSSLTNLACVHSDHEEAGFQMIQELAEAGCRNILTYHDARSCDANIQLQVGFDRAAKALGPKGVTVVSLLPDMENRQRHLAQTFKQNPHWDGVYLVSPGETKGLATALQEIGRDPERVQIVTTCPLTAMRSNTGLERALYRQDLVQVGREAWKTMQALLKGEACAPANLVPCHREGIRVL
jgi:DNA-binding LacI/PurR family transcriptional regulator